MKNRTNLCGDKLKQSFKSNLLYVREKFRYSATVVFKFDADNFNEAMQLEIKIIFKRVEINDVYIGDLNDDRTLDLILQNMHYDVFAYDGFDEFIDDVSFTGHGDINGGNDTFIFRYYRYLEKDKQ